MAGRSDADVWETEVYHALRWRERIAWRVAAASLLVALVAVAGFTVFLHLRSIEYVVVTVDRQTGDAQIQSTMRTVSVSEDEVLAEAFVYQYVRDRETYDAFDQRRRINRIWKYFSGGEAKESLFALYQDDNPANPIRRWEDDIRVRVSINSITFPRQGEAQVRLTKRFVEAGEEIRRRDFIVNLRYRSELGEGPRSTEFRRENPVAFVVTDYRIDAEAA